VGAQATTQQQFRDAFRQRGRQPLDFLIVRSRQHLKLRLIVVIGS